MMVQRDSSETRWPVACLVLLFALQFHSNVFAEAKPEPRHRRIQYNLDGTTPLVTRAGSNGFVPITVDDLKQLVREVTYEGSQVDTVLVCVNAQAVYYPSKVGTMRGEVSTPAERATWSKAEKQWSENVQGFFASGVDPHAVIMAEARERGREVLLSFRMNDDHGYDYLRTKFWMDNPEYRLGSGALDFGHEAVRDYVFRLIEEAMHRYDCGGLELDFNRHPAYFKDGTTEERIGKINGLVERIRKMLDELGNQRGKRLVLSARIPSNFGRTPPTYEHSREVGCDPAAWAKNGWLDFLVVSDFYLQIYYDLPIAPWKKAMPEIPIYGGIECRETREGKPTDQYLTAAKYRRAAKHLWNDGADGIYLFNFFTTREFEADSFEPPFEVLKQLGDPAILQAAH